MKMSVIVSTYNKPQWLEKVIWGYALQSITDFELLVVDAAWKTLCLKCAAVCSRCLPAYAAPSQEDRAHVL